MENLTENMSKIIEKCKMLEDYVSLNFRRETIMPNLEDLKCEINNTRSTVNESKKIIEKDYPKALQKYKDLMVRMRNQQSSILKLIELIKERKKEAFIEINSVKKPSQLQLLTPLATKILKSHNGLQTPKLMYYSDYENSPNPNVQPIYRPLSLFFEFEAKITVEIFNEIPKYMRGRETLDELISFLDNILIPCFIEKYQLISKKRDLVKKASDMQLWTMYKEQASLFPNQKFITLGDLTRKLNKLIDKKIQAKITMLRHLTVINEQRKTSITCYIWLNK